MDGVAYRKFIIKPEIAKEGIGFVKAKYHSINGEIESSWKKEGKKIILNVKIPVNTIANVFVPTKKPETVLESNKLIKTNPNIKIKAYQDNYLNLELGSGSYQIISEN
jgi:alpha-L-rhamnosidase